MPTGPDSVQPLIPGEEDAVDILLQAAFSGPQEAALVRQLRHDCDMADEFVLKWDGAIIGYFALSRMVLPDQWLCLAPVAIAPEWQGKKRGQLMMRLLCEWARTAERYVVVLGQAGFYESGGFSLLRAARLISPYPIEHTMLTGPGDDAPMATLQYAPAFDAL